MSSEDTEPNDRSYKLRWAPPARRQMNGLPEPIAAAIFEFADQAIRQNPHRVGKELNEPFAGLHSARRSTFRIIYQIDDDDHVVDIRAVKHRADAYRRRT